jgi:hypothetical protein
LTDDARLFARAALCGQHAVLGRQDGNLLVFQDVRATNLVQDIVELLPAATPAPGQSVTVARPAPQQPRPATDDGSYDPFASASSPRSSSAQLRRVERLFDKPKLRIGHFSAFTQRRGGSPVALSPVAWFDTEDGRYLHTSRAADDGRQWLTFGPADNPRLVQELSSQLRGYL